MYKYLLLLSLISEISFGQAYQQGYFLDNSGNRTEAWIKDKDKLSIPKTFQYKETENGLIQEASIASVKEYGVGSNRYVRAKVDIDQSSNDLTNLSKSQNPDWKNETLFIRVLVEGNANLYFARVNKEDRFFYNTGDKPVAQLIYKVFTVSPTQSGTNNGFRDQIANEVNCQKLSTEAIKRIRYTEILLRRQFIGHNECLGVHYEPKAPGEKRNPVHLALRPGADFAQAYMTYVNSRDYNFESKTAMRFGAELEVVLPINRKKWALVVEPTYQSYDASHSSPGFNATINSSSLEIPLGIRHYFYINPTSSIFINAQAVFDLPLKYDIRIEHLRSVRNEVLATGFCAGAGFKYRRFSVEGRYYAERNTNLVHSTGLNASIHYQKTSVITGFRLF